MKAQHRKINFANDSKTYHLIVECHCYVERGKISVYQKFYTVTMLKISKKITRHVLECMGYKLRWECHCYVERGKNYFLH